MLNKFDIDGLYPIDFRQKIDGEPADGEEAYWIGFTDKEIENECRVFQNLN